jgi:hypothetical protein
MKYCSFPCPPGGTGAGGENRFGGEVFCERNGGFAADVEVAGVDRDPPQLAKITARINTITALTARAIDPPAGILPASAMAVHVGVGAAPDDD